MRASCFFLLCCSSLVSAEHQIISGTVDVQFEGQRWDITAETDRSILHWDEFSIPQDHAMHFHLPAETSALLNRVHGNLPSHIQGALHSNGAVYLVNPNGIIIGPNSCINVASLVATTLDFSNEDFLQNRDLPFQGSSLASIENSGKLVAQNGDVILFAHRIVNKGTIEAENALLGTGHEILLCLEGTKHFYIKPSSEVADLLLNEGTISASNIALQATSRPSTFAIQNKGRIDATTVVQENGKVYLRAKGGFLENRGTVSGSEIAIEANELASDTTALPIVYNHGTLNADSGDITINASEAYNFGTISASGKEQAGRIEIDVSHSYIEIQKAKLLAEGETGGRISIQANNYFSSGTTSVNGNIAGRIFIDANRLVLAAGHLHASGVELGGKITLRSYSEKHPISINPHSTIQVHSEKAPGAMELQTLLEPKGTLLLENGLQATGACIGEGVKFESPAELSSNFGFGIIPLDTGNVVVSDPLESGGGVSQRGAVHLYDGVTGALVNTITGSSATDRIGRNGFSNAVVSLGENYVIGSPLWDNGGIGNAGAATWVNGTTGEPSGVVSADNSLVGSSANDNVSGSLILVLTNGNYVVGTSLWDDPSGPTTNVGAATWGSSTTGVTGTISAANSLIGTSLSDQVTFNQAMIALTNGNYVIGSFPWDNPDGNTDVGAVTWGNGTTGITGTVSVANSLVGTTMDDEIGNNFTTASAYTGLVALTNGNYTVASAQWDDPSGPREDVGAVTLGNGSTGTTGTVSIANSLIGSSEFDQIGADIEVAALTNGNYVVSSQYWNGNWGAATWGNGSTGITGTVSVANSLTGSQTDDLVASIGIFALTNGNYVVASHIWNDPSGPSQVGAATWGNGSTGITGTVSIANSLVGTGNLDRIGIQGATALTNGNYVVKNNAWSSGGFSFGGAATWGNGSTGITGTVSVANSLIGTSNDDEVGSSVIALTNGNYVIHVAGWNDPSGPTALVGAATWSNGSIGITGTISVANSLIGTTANDRIGFNALTALTNGNYVVGGRSWINEGLSNAGAATWGNGATGTTGTVSPANSLVGSVAGQEVVSEGNGFPIPLPNGHYIIITTKYPTPETQQGAVTVGDGFTGTYCDAYGTVTSENSFIGPNDSSQLSLSIPVDTANDRFLVRFGNEGGVGSVYSFEIPAAPPPSPSPSAAAAETPPAKGRVDYNIAISETFQQWSSTFLRGMVEDNIAPPMDTHKQFSLPLRSLVRDLEKETP